MASLAALALVCIVCLTALFGIWAWKERCRYAGAKTTGHPGVNLLRLDLSGFACRLA